MKSFIYQVTESRPNRNGYRKRAAKVWEVENNKPTLLFEYDDYFCSGFQIVLDGFASLGRDKLPTEAFEKAGHGGWKYSTPEKMLEAGIAKFYEI